MIVCAVTCLSMLSSCASQKDLHRNICDQNSDIPSRAVSSDLVFEGELVRRFRPSSNISFGVTFKVLQILKGGSDLDNRLNLVTSHKCISTAMKSRTRYIVFTDHRTSADKISTGSRRIKYRISVMPVIANKEAIKTVRRSARSENCEYIDIQYNLLIHYTIPVQCTKLKNWTSWRSFAPWTKTWMIWRPTNHS